MLTQNCGAVVRLARIGRHIQLRLFSNPGPFPFGAPGKLGTAQYVGIADHLVLTLMEDRYLPGLLGFQADVPFTPEGRSVIWCGGVACAPLEDDLAYRLHCLFVRDPEQLMAGLKDLHVAARVTGISGVISARQYWLVEVPSLTREVLLNLDEIVLVRRRTEWKPSGDVPTKLARGEFWQMAGFKEHPAHAIAGAPGHDQPI